MIGFPSVLSYLVLVALVVVLVLHLVVVFNCSCLVFTWTASHLLFACVSSCLPICCVLSCLVVALSWLVLYSSVLSRFVFARHVLASLAWSGLRFCEYLIV